MSSDSNGINFMTSGTGNSVPPVPQTPSSKRSYGTLSENQEKNKNHNASENVFTTNGNDATKRRRKKVQKTMSSGTDSALIATLAASSSKKYPPKVSPNPFESTNSKSSNQFSILIMCDTSL